MREFRLAALMMLVVTAGGCAAMNARVDPVNKAVVSVKDDPPRTLVFGKRPSYVYFSSLANTAAFDAQPSPYLGFGF